MITTARGMVSGQTTAITVAAPITAQQCATSASPRHDERVARGAHSSAVKKSLGLTRAATAMARVYHGRAGGKTMRRGRRASGTRQDEGVALRVLEDRRRPPRFLRRRA